MKIHTLFLVLFFMLTPLKSPYAQTPAPTQLQSQDPVPGKEMEAGGIVFVWCPPGTFDRGENIENTAIIRQFADFPVWYSDEKPVCSVSIENGFWLAKFEMSIKQWNDYAAAADHKAPPATPDEHYEERAVADVDLTQIRALLETLNKKGLGNFRLPTEDEWEYACRAGATTSFYFSDDAQMLGDNAWFMQNTRNTVPDAAQTVGRKKPNAWNLHDMLGNVWEWCDTPYAAYDCKGSNTRESGAPASTYVLRGGSYASTAAFLRCATRMGMQETAHSPRIGFRLVWMP